MKNLLIVSVLAISIIACKKDSSSTPASSTPVVTPTPTPSQDANLIGVWVQDSEFTAGNMTVDKNLVYDTLYMSSSAFNEKTWNYYFASTPPYQNLTLALNDRTWQTNGDSILTYWSSYQWHYQYTITGTNLFLNEKSITRANYWYHKI